MESAVADLRQGVVGFMSRSNSGRDGGGIIWVGKGGGFCELPSPTFSSGDCGWPKGNRSGEEKAERGGSKGIEQRVGLRQRGAQTESVK